MKRIYMISSYPLFSKGVECMLDGTHNIEIVGRASNANDACREVKLLCPDAVIFDSRDPSCHPEGLLLRLMRENPGLRIVGLNLQDDTLCTYLGETRIAQDIDSVIEAITR